MPVERGFDNYNHEPLILRSELSNPQSTGTRPVGLCQHVANSHSFQTFGPLAQGQWGRSMVSFYVVLSKPTLLLVSPTRVFPPRSDGQLWVAGKARVKLLNGGKYSQ